MLFGILATALMGLTELSCESESAKDESTYQNVPANCQDTEESSEII